MARYAMHIDLSKCYGCRSCMIACKVENNTSQGIHWMYVFRMEDHEYPDAHVWALPRPCQHCDNAPCVSVCPVGAMFKREDGIVVADHDRSIGCRYCEVACPYGVIYFNWKDPAKNQYFDWNEVGAESMGEVVGGMTPSYRNPDFDFSYRGGGETEGREIAGGAQHKGVVEKCTFCVHRVSQGLEPACANICPASAITFGDVEDPESEVSAKVTGTDVFRLGEEVGTRPSVYYSGHAEPTTETRQIESVKGAF